MSATLGHSIVIDNRGGAGGAIGTDTVAKPRRTERPLGLAAPARWLRCRSVGRTSYDVLRDLAPITLIGRGSGVLVTNPKRGFKTVADLVAFAKANPKKINFASAGTGTSIHLSGELFALMAGIQVVHVPYAKGALPGITDLLGGHVDMMLPDITGVLEYIRSGALVALAVTGEVRSKQLPDVPTMGEAGYPKVVSESWSGLIAPAKMPRTMLDEFHGAAMAALKSPDVIKKIELLGSVPAPMTQEQFRAFIAAEQAKWKFVIEALGFRQ